MPSADPARSETGGPADAPRGSLLLVTAYFPPWGGGGVLRVTKLVKYLARMGWRITVVCSDELQPEVVDTTLLDEIPGSVRVLRVRGPLRSLGGRARGAASSSSRRGLLRPLVSTVKAAIRAVLIPDRWVGWAWTVQRLRDDMLGDPDVVLSSGPPHSAHLAASSIARRLSVPHVVDLRDDWGGNPLHRNPAPWHGPLDRMLERRALTRAASIVTIFETSSRELARRYPKLTERIVTIPNGFDPEDFVGLPPRVAREADETVRFLYAGSLRGSQEVGRFFEVFGEVARASPGSIHLTLLGFISSRHEDMARSSIPEAALDVQAPIPHRAALEAMAAADVLVLFTGGGGAAGGLTLTGKLYEYLALARPVVLIGPEGPAADLVRRFEGAIAGPDDHAAIAVAIEAARDAAAEIRRRPSDLQYFDRSRQAAQLDALLLRMVGGVSDAGPA